MADKQKSTHFGYRAVAADEEAILGVARAAREQGDDQLG